MTLELRTPTERLGSDRVAVDRHVMLPAPVDQIRVPGVHLLVLFSEE
jgi:hypothetical protein